MKACVVTCWPKDIYYPLWVEQMNEYSELFGRIIIVMTQSASDRDYSSEIARNIPKAVVVREIKNKKPDWRNAATHEALKYVISPSVLFLEQDFMVKDGFYEELLKKGESYGSVGFKDGNRFHPACLLVKKEVLDNVEKDFSPEPDIGDHFYKFSKEIKKIKVWTTLEELNLNNWFHMAGLTQNYRLEENFYQPRQFYTYLASCKWLDQPESWKEFSAEVKAKVGKYPFDERVKSFFDE